MTPESQPAQGDGCTCQNCGMVYFADLLVPDDVWAAISPECNLLCPTCIAERIVRNGIWTAIRGFDVDGAQGDTLAAVVAELRKPGWLSYKACQEMADCLEKLAAVPVGVTEEQALRDRLFTAIAPSMPDVLGMLPLLKAVATFGKFARTSYGNRTIPDALADAIGTLTELNEACCSVEAALAQPSGAVGVCNPPLPRIPECTAITHQAWPEWANYRTRDAYGLMTFHENKPKKTDAGMWYSVGRSQGTWTKCEPTIEARREMCEESRPEGSQGG